MNTQDLTISWEGESHSCRIGKGGARPASDKREGDGATPLGKFPVRWGFWRADRLAEPRSRLTFHPIGEGDLWCDDPDHPAYNRWVREPMAASHEVLMREDCAYDIVVVMGHNDEPPEPGLGSAVFLHLDRPDHRSTLGCVAVEPEVMVRLVRVLEPGSTIEIG